MTNYSEQELVDWVPISIINWSGETEQLDHVQFSGTLTIVVDPADLREGEELQLLEFLSSSGNFTNIQVEAGSCNVVGQPQVTLHYLIFQVDDIVCTTAVSVKNTLME